MCLAKALGIEMPKNQILNTQFFKSKAFILQSKEAILKKLFATLNESNRVQLAFERANF